MSNNDVKRHWAERWAAILLAPLVLLGLGITINGTMQEEQVRSQYVGIAVRVLDGSMRGDKRARPTGSEIALRNWAVDVLAENSPVPLPQDVLAALRSGDARISTSPIFVGERESRTVVNSDSQDVTDTVITRDGE